MAFVTLTCAYCARSFRAEQTHNRRYCSEQCFRAAKHAATRIELRCEHCGKLYEATASLSNRRFCSHKCKIESAYVTIECENCGVLFQTPRSHATPEQKRFCSDRCRVSYHGETNIEALIHQELEKRGVAFDYQVRLGSYRVDFILLDFNAVIECDGEYWHSNDRQRRHDLKKDQFLVERGYIVFRLSERDILASPAACIEQVLAQVRR